VVLGASLFSTGALCEIPKHHHWSGRPGTAGNHQPDIGNRGAAGSDGHGGRPTPENAKKAERISREVGSSANPKAAEKALNASDRALLKAFNTVTRTEVLPEVTTPAAGPGAGSTPVTAGTGPTMTLMAASGCWNVSQSSVARNVFGSWLYKLTVSGGFCTNGSYVYSKWFNGSWGETFWIGWRDGGQTYSNSVIAGGSARIVGQRVFIYGVGGWDVQSSYPCVRLFGYWNGSTGADTSCNPW
jgi:hypothetical protein